MSIALVSHPQSVKQTGVDLSVSPRLRTRGRASRRALNGSRLLRFTICFLVVPALVQAREPTPEKLILAHYMPWYVARPVSKVWGWHWTMNHFDPEKIVDGKREIASHFYPVIGPYDSGDPHVIEYHLLTMKLAGIDGVIVDWYGLSQLNDYPILHRNTLKLVAQVERLGMKFAVCYEDQTIPKLVKAGRLKQEARIGQAASEIAWLSENWFKLDSYVRLERKPVLLSFGQTGLSNAEWSGCLDRIAVPVAYFSQHHRRDAAVGAFDWPSPKKGTAAAKAFRDKSVAWRQSIQVAFPRFVDVYKKARLHDGYGFIDDARGNTFRETLEGALRTASPVVQIATWNDWGEGTQIEPSNEFAFRDLELVQAMRRRYVDSDFAFGANDLKLPQRLLEHRRSRLKPQSRLDTLAQQLSSGKLVAARTTLESIDTSVGD